MKREPAPLPEIDEPFMRESTIKLHLLNWLLSNIHPSEAIAAELQFTHGLHRADLVRSTPSELIAYEIKSSYDDFRRFEKQQAAYNSAFSECYLVIPAELTQIAKSHVDRRTGVIIVSPTGDVQRRRKAVRKVTLSRAASLSWMRHTDRNKLDLAALTDRELAIIALERVYLRLKPRFDTFMLERGVSLNSDDLQVLSMPTRVR